MTGANPGVPPFGIHEQLFTVGSIRINYAEGAGVGRPLVLLHGLARNWQDLLPLIPGLSAHYHLFAVDLRGHGKSSRVPRAYTITGYASDVVAFLRSAVETPVVLFGHSLGGIVAMYIASFYPELVRALILGDTMLERDAFPSSMYFSFFQTLHALLRQRTSISDLATRLARAEICVPGLEHPVAIGDLPGNDTDSLLRWADCLDQVDPETIEMALDGSSYAEYDADKWLSRISCPTLLLQASPELGGLISDSQVSAAMKILRNPTLVQFPLLGHALHQQGAASVLQAVTSYLASL